MIQYFYCIFNCEWEINMISELWRSFMVFFPIFVLARRLFMFFIFVSKFSASSSFLHDFSSMFQIIFLFFTHGDWFIWWSFWIHTSQHSINWLQWFTLCYTPRVSMVPQVLIGAKNYFEWSRSMKIALLMKCWVLFTLISYHK